MRNTIVYFCIWLFLYFYLAGVIGTIIRCISNDIKDSRLVLCIIVPLMVIIEDVRFSINETKKEKKYLKKVKVFFISMRTSFKVFQISLGAFVMCIKKIKIQQREVNISKKYFLNIIKIVKNLESILGSNEDRRKFRIIN